MKQNSIGVLSDFGYMGKIIVKNNKAACECLDEQLTKYVEFINHAILPDNKIRDDKHYDETLRQYILTEGWDTYGKSIGLEHYQSYYCSDKLYQVNDDIGEKYLLNAWTKEQEPSELLLAFNIVNRGGVISILTPDGKRVSWDDSLKSCLVAEDARQAAVEHYKIGIQYYSQGNYDKAKEEWETAPQLNPEYSDPAVGLKRIEAQYGSK